ncbi:MAG: exodeoxyribonuclease VII large subunit [Saprospiraceae bacterium]|nr:exodeoxyribonuclease VII large subunit [Saprospiraceae bacterium]
MYTVLRLSQIQDRIQRALVLNFSEPLWIRAEVAQSRLNRGHYYLQLVEKAEGSDERIAQIDAVLWGSRSRVFPDTVKQELPHLLEEGHEIQALVRIDYHPIYGLKLNLEDIDLSIAEGKMALRRQQIIQELDSAGLLHKNKELLFPQVIQRVAVITSLQAAGWQDFQAQLQDNPYGFQFRLEVFPAAMQGASVEQDVLNQLDTITQRLEGFDVCVIIRGGGSKLDLAWFDNRSIGEKIARMGIPVLTGIGHEIDETVSDLVAARSLKTPTAVASFILETNLQFDSLLYELGRQINQETASVFQQAHANLDQIKQALIHTSSRWIEQREWEVRQLTRDLQQSAAYTLNDHQLRLSHYEEQILQLDPATILSRGFSMTMYQNKPLRDPSEIAPGEEITTYLEHGILTSITQTNE